MIAAVAYFPPFLYRRPKASSWSSFFCTSAIDPTQCDQYSYLKSIFTKWIRVKCDLRVFVCPVKLWLLWTDDSDQGLACCCWTTPCNCCCSTCCCSALKSVTRIELLHPVLSCVRTRLCVSSRVERLSRSECESLKVSKTSQQMAF